MRVKLTTIALVIATSSASAVTISETTEETVARFTTEGKVMLDRLPGLCSNAVLDADKIAGFRHDASSCCVTLLEGGVNGVALRGALLLPWLTIPKSGNRVADMVVNMMRKKVEKGAGKRSLAEQADTVLENTWNICYAVASKP